MSKTSLMAPLCTAWETSVPNPFPFLLSPSQHHLPPSLLVLLPSVLPLLPPSLLSAGLPRLDGRPLQDLHHLLWDHQYQECQEDHGHPGGLVHQEIHVHLGNLVHPVRGTRGSTQAKAMGKMRWGEGHIPPNPRQAADLRGKGN